MHINKEYRHLNTKSWKVEYLHCLKKTKNGGGGRWRLVVAGSSIDRSLYAYVYDKNDPI